MKSIKIIKNLRNKCVLVRVDFNLPITDGKITDTTRIKLALPTIKYLSQRKAKVLILSHFGSGKEKVFKKLTLKPVSESLSYLLDTKIFFIKDCIGNEVKKKIAEMTYGDICLLENTRFYDEEIKNDKLFAKKIAKNADIYINEAFSVAHRNHASISAITNYLPSYAGLRFEKEIQELNKLKKDIKRPYIILLGGAKISTKIGLIENIAPIADKVLLGGAMLNHFLFVKGIEIGKSFTEKNYLEETGRLFKKFQDKFIFPIDVLVARPFFEKAVPQVRRLDEILRDDIILDIGPETIRKYSNELNNAKTILWNGPMGKFEIKKFSHGSLILARVVASRARGRAFGVCGGGETIEILERTKMARFVDWVSGGGGAMLFYLSGKKMPGIEALNKDKSK